MREGLTDFWVEILIPVAVELVVYGAVDLFSLSCEIGDFYRGPILVVGVIVDFDEFRFVALKSKSSPVVLPSFDVV